MMGPKFTILDRLGDSDIMCHVSPADARIFFNELEATGNYQILVGKREGDHSDQIEIFVSYPKKQA